MNRFVNQARRLKPVPNLRIVAFAIVLIFRSAGLLAQEPYLVKDINEGTGNATIDYVAALGNRIIFAAEDGVHGTEPWVSDGTSGGTVLLKDINPGGDSGMYDTTAVPELGLVFFGANDGTNGEELWKSDGTPEGTALIDIRAGGSSSPFVFTSFNGLLFFQANGGDGTGAELWKSDGTLEGTERVADINTGLSASAPQSLVVLANTLYFSAHGPDNDGRELWKSDGTEEGTVQVKDIWEGAESSSPDFFVELNGQILFRATDSDHGEELWKTDGTEEGTLMVTDINESGDASPQDLIVLDGAVYFRADDGANGTELWKTDGTEEGTTMVRDIDLSGSGLFTLPNFREFGSVLLFRANDGTSGLEPWKTDGTELGTVMLKELNPGGTSSPNEYTPLGDRAFFSAFGGDVGSELWQTDGTEEGTTLRRDLMPGSSGSSPNILAAAGGRLFLEANEGNGLGGELYALLIDPPHLANISTRGQVGTGDNVMIAGIIIEGSRKRVLVRALGPTLDDFGVANTLDDPFLQIFSGASPMGSNDDWRDTQETEIEATGFAPPDDVEPGIILELDPGNYTAIVSGAGETTGNAIVEVFELD